MSLRLKNVTHAYGAAPVVRDVSFCVDPGEIFALFGPSGCGKTTILRLIAGLEDLQSGEIQIDKNSVASARRSISPQKRPIGFVFQDFVLFPHLTVRQNVEFGVPSNAKERPALVEKQLLDLDLGELGDRYPDELSGGQQQRVALARTLIRKPKAILLDEPFASIDAVLRKRLRGQMRTLLKTQNVASILVTHDAEEAIELGDRVGLMRDGRLIETASPVELFEAPKTPEGARMFTGSQQFQGEVSGGVVKTMIGAFSTGATPDGPATVVIRDGAIVAKSNSNGEFAIVDTRFAGPHWIATVKAPAGQETCRATIDDSHKQGDRVDLTVDEDGVFVFSA